MVSIAKKRRDLSLLLIDLVLGCLSHKRTECKMIRRFGVLVKLSINYSVWYNRGTLVYTLDCISLIMGFIWCMKGR